jgi:hypothetical protein
MARSGGSEPQDARLCPVSCAHGFTLKQRVFVMWCGGADFNARAMLQCKLGDIYMLQYVNVRDLLMDGIIQLI